MDGTGSQDTLSRSKIADKRRRIRSWAILIALLLLSGVVYGIAILRMIQQHTLPHFS
ncbi:MAG: hypothetical protein ACREFO_18085 [Acetobacteraceae bacterium]